MKLLHLLEIYAIFWAQSVNYKMTWCPEEDSNLHTLASTST